MKKVLELLKKCQSLLLSLFKGLIGLIRGEGNEEDAKKVGKFLAGAFLAMCTVNTVAAILKAKKEGKRKS